jgi:hypothetical protein
LTLRLEKRLAGGQAPDRMPGKYKDLITEHRREETGHGEMRPRRFAGLATTRRRGTGRPPDAGRAGRSARPAFWAGFAAGRLPVLVSRLA